MTEPRNPFPDAEPDATPAQHPDHCIRLYIEGNGTRSTEALRLVASICREKLGSDYRLDVIDLQQSPRLAARDDIVAAPTLVKERPLPIRRATGRLTREQVLEALDLT